MIDCRFAPEPSAYCDFEGCELYPGDPYYLLDGLTICEDCLTPFVRRWLAPYRRAAGEGGFFCIP